MTALNVPGHSPLEVLYWLSQTVGVAIQLILVCVAVWAGVAAHRQISAIKLFELLKYIQNENFRKARRAVVHEIGPLKETAWWEDRELENKASDCCAHYDILGNMLLFGSTRPR